MGLGDIANSFLDTGLNVATFGGYGATQSADAAQKTAEDQKNEATSLLSQAQGYAQMTPDEMVAMSEQLDHLNKMNAIFGQQISNSSAVLAAVNPAFLSAGKNAVDIMNGKAAPTLAPLHAQIDQQRQNLQTQLASMYGPGWSSSSAGIEAMQRFEQGAQSTLANAQQSYLGTLLGGASQGAQVNETAMNNGARTMGDLFNQTIGTQQSFQKLNMDALATFNPTQYMGAQYLGDMRKGQYFSQQGQFIDTMPLAFLSAMHGGSPAQTQQAAGGGGGGGGGDAMGGGGGMPFSMPQGGDASLEVA